ncbi:MAG: hypothetical protein MPK62_02100 [Alphaproteobacteria bacterium]|nr:hypothetical protein [Alphaproteobacteria bacterium]MDA8029926.1 hypothetical protein [Alphaproteobacteria bacterium]
MTVAFRKEIRNIRARVRQIKTKDPTDTMDRDSITSFMDEMLNENASSPTATA